MSKNNNSTKFSIRRKIRNSKRLIYQGFQGIKEWLFLHKIPILRELVILLVFVLIAVVFLQFLYLNGLRSDYSDLNNAYNDNQSLLESLNDELNDLIKNNNKLNDKIKGQQKEIEEQRKIIDEKDEFVKAIKKESNVTKEKLTSNQQSVSRGGGVVSNNKNNNNNEWATFQATAYSAFCDTGCTGFTKTQHDVRNTIYIDGYRVIAVDPKRIPLYSIVEIQTPSEQFQAIALDTGGAIKGNRIDILTSSRSKAYEFGRKNVEVRVIRNGKGG